MTLAAENLTVRRGNRVTLESASLSVAPGEFVGLLGPNGAGKTTLMRAILGLVDAEGHSSLAALAPARRALVAAWLPQEREAAWPVTVENLVRLGRIPHRRLDADQAHIDAALARMGLLSLRHRPVTTLSGGERARSLIARALAQDTAILLADEPIAGLDPSYQVSTMALFRELADDGRIVMASLHDLGLAARHCTRLILMNEGRIRFDGPPPDALSRDRIAEIFGIEAHVEMTKEGLVFQPLRVLS